jgi:putative oxidoreductase
MFDLGLLILRVVVGLILFGHGAQKLFGWFGGHGLKGTAGWLGAMGMQPAGFWALVAGLSEAGGGVLLALGLLNPIGSLGVIAAMLTAIVKVHWTKGLWAGKGGMELPLTNLVAALTIALTGPGTYSLDARLGVALPEPITLIAGLAVVILGVAATSLAKPAEQPMTPNRRTA